MLPSDQRLRTKKDFNKVYSLGKCYQDKFLKVFVYEENAEVLKIGFVVSKKVNKQAVKRNRIKRRLREACRFFWGDLKKGVYVIFVAKSPMNHVGFKQVTQSMHRLLQLARIYEQEDYSVQH